MGISLRQCARSCARRGPASRSPRWYAWRGLPVHTILADDERFGGCRRLGEVSVRRSRRPLPAQLPEVVVAVRQPLELLSVDDAAVEDLQAPQVRDLGAEF